MSDRKMNQGPRGDVVAEETRGMVRERYASLAAAERSCCGGSAETLAYVRALYTEDEIASLPERVRQLAMGCGNPVALADLEPGMTVIDLGSGGGIDAILAALRVGPEGRVIGVDMTPEMIEAARANVAETTLRNVEFRRGEIEALPVEDSAADVIISNCVINLSPDKRQVFREAYRVLKPGGRLAVSDMVLLRELPGFIRDDPVAWSSCVAGAIPLADYLGAIDGAGFANTVVRELTAYSGAEVAAFKEIDPQLFGAEGSLTPEEVGELGGCLASARVVAVKPSSCCCC